MHPTCFQVSIMYRYLIIFLSILESYDSFKILGISPIYSKSHNSMHQIILKELVSRGHQVTSLSYFKSDINATNYQEFYLPSEQDESFVDTIAISDLKRFLGFWNHLTVAQEMENNGCAGILQNSYIQKLVKSKKPLIDLLISETYYSKCFCLLAYKLKIPLITISPPITSVGIDNFNGNSFNPSYVPMLLNGYTPKMNFFQRLINFIDYTNLYWYQYFFYDSCLKQLSRKFLYIDLPSNQEMNDKIAISFYNNHFSFISRPEIPNVIDIAGLHITEAKPIPKDILEFLESSEHGTIFFSFGTTLKVSGIPEEIINIFIDVFSTIPQKVLWRANQLNVANLPSNVRIGKWFPQRDILEHKNVVAFISHCGLFGTLEAIHTATPVLAIPFMFDQPQNANILVEKGVGIRLDFEDITKEKLLKSIQEITNQKYKNNMARYSKIFRDRPISPLDSAIYWIEYVIKHKGANHLKTPSANMSLYQYLLLDVIIFLIGIVIFFIFIVKKIFKIILSNFGNQKIQR